LAPVSSFNSHYNPRKYHHPHFTDEETDGLEVKSLANHYRLVNGQVKIQSQFCLILEYKPLMTTFFPQPSFIPSDLAGSKLEKSVQKNPSHSM
jgi:hypothetical protein